MPEQTTQVPAITKSIHVEAPVERAFAVFTEGIATWWPLRTHSRDAERSVTVVFEPRQGGRVYETLDDGSEVDWGRVEVWEPPTRFVMTWGVSRSPGEEQILELAFTDDGDGTRVNLIHEAWERLGDRAKEAREQYDGGWDAVLGCYVQRLAERPT